MNMNFTGAKRNKFCSLRTNADQLANKGTPVLINVDDNMVRKDTTILILLPISQQLFISVAAALNFNTRFVNAAILSHPDAKIRLKNRII